MKISKYNLILQKDCRYFVYNQLRQSLLEIDYDLSQAIKSCNIDSIPQDCKEQLFKNGVLCDNKLDETNVVLAQNSLFRFANSTIRVTILPTLNCNFHCWYCYEQHYKSSIDKGGVENIVTFCKKLLERTGVKRFQLDWFGGEPLLYFYETIMPISIAVQDLCLKNNVAFLNTITTNGFLLSSNMIDDMKKINLNGFQITLDGGKAFHNKVRFTSRKKGSFDTIVTNIVKLCRNISDIKMTVRINYTPSNIDSICEIGEAFPNDVREHIQFSPQIVWQHKEESAKYAHVVCEVLEKFVKLGYKKAVPTLKCSSCYAENMNQYVVNFDLSVYKCTARDFDQKYSIGKIEEDGAFMPSSHYYDFFVSSGIEDDECKRCHLLPSCLGNCIQKVIEGQKICCHKEEQQEQVLQKVLLYLTQLEV